ncbi:pyridoxamine 5'-phosphate oxidase family protein [Methylomonas koyamae]|uniref:pyridoxamine 5'-phosphate oxidase family protein n=1 Tax=Methylomonas koyamae TaxID=702114 RepID=UPI002873758B|nr:pyridoxamine 5'-phosphate oxidase family protein [Methylomonas koyamae]WNB74787.1 pyridoxamine 5'-phosphate oxidase family protein [Methylomonas koyamae]
MNEFYGPHQRELQARHDTVKLADRLQQIIVEPQINEQHQAFIESRDFFFLTTVDHRGYPTCSYKGGNPGLVRVAGPQELAFPNYDGNGMFLSLGNINGNPKIGLLFIDFETPHRIRVHGDASIQTNDPLLTDYPGAESIVRVAISEIFVNCPRYIHRMHRVASSKYVPQAHQATPLPQWKRIDAVQDVLPAGDQHIAESLGGIITPEQYGAMVISGDA